MKNRSCGLCAARRGLGNPRAGGQGSRHKHSPGAPRAPTPPPSAAPALTALHGEQGESHKPQAASCANTPQPQPPRQSQRQQAAQNSKTPISLIQSREAAYGGIGQRRIRGFRQEGLRGSRHPRGLSKRFARERWGLKSKRFPQARIHWAICVCVSVRVSRKQ